MRKPLMAVAAAALSVASLAGCKLDVTPVDDHDQVVGATTINGNGTTIFSETATQLGTYRATGSVDDNAACSWTLFENDNNDAGDEQQVRLDGDNLVDDNTNVPHDADSDEDVNADEDQIFQLRDGDARLVAENCNTFERIGN